MPVTLAVLVIGGLSVIGVPPLCGFFSKWYLVLGAIQAQAVAVCVGYSLQPFSMPSFFFEFSKDLFRAPRSCSGRGREPALRSVDRCRLGELDPDNLSGLLHNPARTFQQHAHYPFYSRAIPGDVLGPGTMTTIYSPLPSMLSWRLWSARF